MKITTTTCSESGHPEFVIECSDAVPEQDVNIFVSYLEESVRSGEVYKNGETFAIGWMLTMISQLEDGRLTIVEPDMKSFPIEWTYGITSTLQHQRCQKDTVESVLSSDEMDIPDIRHSMRVGIDVRENTVNLFLERTEPKDRRSGWFLGNVDSELDYSDSDHYRCESLYAVALEHPHIIKYMALPSGTRVECSPWKIEISWNGKRLKIKPLSFLAGLLRQMKRMNGPSRNTD